MMPPFLEEAAHLLRMLVSAGLIILPGVDCRPVLFKLAAAILRLTQARQRLSHADAAVSILKELEADKMVACELCKRPKVLAILGTTVGNILAMRSVARSRK